MVEVFSTEAKMLMQLHYSRLSEKDRRQYAGLEAVKLGWGGISYISALLGIHKRTVMEGIKELAAETPLPPGRQRRAGGGRKKNGKKS